MHVTLFIAFIGGLVSFFSPCVFPLVPAYVATITGSTISNGAVNTTKLLIFTRSLAFTLGFSLIFIILGASTSFIGHWLMSYRAILEKVGGFLIVIFGFQMAGFLNIRFLFKEKRLTTKQSKQVNTIRATVMGMFFAIGWSPCIGLTLSSILLLASSEGTVAGGMTMLTIYSVGFAIPFILLGLVISVSLKSVKRINKWMPYISNVGGWLLVIVGLLLYTNQLEKLNAWFNGLLNI